MLLEIYILKILLKFNGLLFKFVDSLKYLEDKLITKANNIQQYVENRMEMM